MIPKLFASLPPPAIVGFYGGTCKVSKEVDGHAERTLPIITHKFSHRMFTGLVRGPQCDGYNPSK
jgi:hypothetical protein